MEWKIFSELKVKFGSPNFGLSFQNVLNRTFIVIHFMHTLIQMYIHMCKSWDVECATVE